MPGTETPWRSRAATCDDIDAIVRHRFFRHDAAPLDVAACRDWLRTRMEGGRYLARLAEVDGQVVAGAGGTLLDWGPTRGDTCHDRCRIVNVFTEPAWRRRGIAEALVRGVMGMAAARGVRTFVLASSADGSSVYRRLGFETYPHEMIRRP